ncbi:MAG: oxidoreductase domain-containing protein, partial [Candidatus Uhrbacteria bacterium GW2011_GWF2_41_16]
MLKLGVIGMSEGNGHPYSWSAIVNGKYNEKEMANCGYAGIPVY